MQLLFGVLGDADRAAGVFGQLVAASADSNPGLTPSVAADKSIRLGHVSRAFAVWHEKDANRSFYLDGEIRLIDGRETTHRGTGDDDLAALAKLYRNHGPAFWERLDGSFCLIVRDGNAFHIGVDVAGTRAIYWWFHEGLLAFHSHFIDLAPAYPGTLTEDLGALGCFLACGGYPPTATAYRAIHHLGAGQCLSMVDGTVHAREHFRLVFRDVSFGKPIERLADEMIDLLSTSFRRSWRAATNPVVPLSGGMDSRYLAGELVRQAGDPGAVHTITWGEDRSRADGDAAIASRVAAALGVENTWHEKSQRHSAASFGRAIYLSSGEADCAIHYPEDHVLHAELAGRLNYASLFRGDEFFGDPPVVTDRAVLISAADVTRLDPNGGYRALLDRGILQQMAREQAMVLEASVAGLESSTPHGRSEEIYYLYRWRRWIAVYNTVKHADLEVYTPFMDREVLEWIKGTPARFRSDAKELLMAAMARRFPELAAIPFASRSNLPDWRLRWSRDPTVARFFLSWCTRPGWLDTIGTKPQILAALEAIETAAAAGTFASEPEPLGQRPHADWRRMAKKTYPGRLLRELTLERRYARNNLPPYLRLARLAVLHGLLGRIGSRRAAPVPMRTET